jgi:DNA invertase Pin-like site-specific DNA recombinase
MAAEIKKEIQLEIAHVLFIDIVGYSKPAAGIMLALLAEMARNESETLRERTKSGLAHARKRGVVLGRRKGTTLTRDQFLQKHTESPAAKSCDLNRLGQPRYLTDHGTAKK